MLFSKAAIFSLFLQPFSPVLLTVCRPWDELHIIKRWKKKEVALCLCFVFATLCMWGRKEQVGGPFERRRPVWSEPEWCATSASLPFPYCLICNESSFQTVCQGSLFRVKFTFFIFILPLHYVFLFPLPTSPSSPASLLWGFKFKRVTADRVLKPALMGDGAHLLNMLPITASLGLCPDSKLEI